MKLDPTFYRQSDVTRIARDLVGKCLFTRMEGKTTGGIIVETEAYSRKERGSHAYQNRMTARNAAMFREGGHAYVYLCYGIHHLFNVVTNVQHEADAVLIRALQPVEGVPEMMKRMKVQVDNRITSGPGKLSKAMAIDLRLNGSRIGSRHLWIEDVGNQPGPRDIVRAERIGIDYAGKDARLPWRFMLKGSLWVSKL